MASFVASFNAIKNLQGYIHLTLERKISQMDIAAQAPQP